MVDAGLPEVLVDLLLKQEIVNGEAAAEVGAVEYVLLILVAVGEFILGWRSRTRQPEQVGAPESGHHVGDVSAITTTLTFNAGETFKLVTVIVKGDTTKEGDETFFLNLNTPTNATIAVGKGTGTIRNDD